MLDIGRRALLAALLLGLTGCETIYKAATEERPLSVLVDDEVITTKIKKGFLDRAPKALGLNVFCHQGVVVLAGAPEPSLGEQAVAIARAVQGVKRVETYFLPGQPAPLQDFQTAAKIKAKIIGDGALRISQVDMAVIAGHVVLTGVVDRPEKIEQIVRHARAVEGVVAVRSFLQLKTQ